MTLPNAGSPRRPFVGRRDRIEAFKDVLRKVFARDEAPRPTSQDWDQYDPISDYDDTASSMHPYVVLVSGHGGIGKSHLLELLHMIASRAQEANQCRTLPIIRLEEGSYFSIRGRDTVKPNDVLDIIYRALQRTFTGELATSQRARAQIKIDTGDVFDINGMAAIGNEIRQTRNEFGSVQITVGTEGGKPAASANPQQRREEQFRELRDALSDDLRRISTALPLVVFIDTYELVDTVDRFIRPLYIHSGKGVVWVIAGRNDLVPDRPGSDASEPFRGYESERLVTNLVDMALKELTVDDISDFLRRENVSLEQSQIYELYNVTRGNALALNIAVSMLKKHQPLAKVLAYQDTPLLRKLSLGADLQGDNDLVYQMTNRLLLYCADERERRALYALALARRPLLPVLEAMIQPPKAIDAFLVDLERQYDFVSAHKRNLHDTVQYFLEKKLLEELRDGGERELVVDLCARALDVSRGALLARTGSLGTVIVQRLMADDEWSIALLDYLHYALWLEPERGARELFAAYCCASRYQSKLTTQLHTIALNLQERAEPGSGPWLEAVLPWKTSDDPGQSHLAKLLQLVTRRELDAVAWHPEPQRAWGEVRAVLYAKQGEYFDPFSTYLGDKDKKDLKRAVEWYEKGLAAYDSMDWLLRRTGYSYHGLKRWQDMLVMYTRAIELFPDATDISKAFDNRGVAYGKLGRYQEGLDDHNRALSIKPNVASTINNRGLKYLELGRYEEALADFNRALELDPRYHQAWHNLGSLYDSSLGKIEEALECYNKALKISPRDVATLSYRAGVYAKLGDYSAAMRDFEQAIAIDPDSDLVYNERGRVYDRMGQYELAVADFNRSLQFGPDHPITLGNRALAYYHMAQYELALADYHRSLALRPDDATILNNRGLTYEAQGSYDLALADYNRSLALQPDSHIVLNNRGFVYNTLEDYDRALADYNRSLELRPDDIITLANRGTAYRNMQQYDKALRDLDRAVALDRGDPVPLSKRGICYAFMERFDEAFADFQRALDLGKKRDWPLFYLAATHALRRQPAEALDYLRQAIEVEPGIKRNATRGPLYRVTLEPLRASDPAFAAGFDALVADGGGRH